MCQRTEKVAEYIALIARIEKVNAKVPRILNLLVATLFGLMLSTPAFAEVEQCRFIQAKAEREACYTRQEAALAAKRKPEPRADTGTIEPLQQMRREDAEVYRSLSTASAGAVEQPPIPAYAPL